VKMHCVLCDARNEYFGIFTLISGFKKFIKLNRITVILFNKSVVICLGTIQQRVSPRLHAD
jgi:hypothetical protein